ncbi:MAG: metalloregulator ArsR/SmtB family transcription factor [Bacillota bacterium]|nr:metalloregulator ArsR/SmtB family transcription factor [Bacillota bacterium]
MDIKKYTKIFKALSNENRLEIYLKIVEKQEASFDTGDECFINEIAGCFKIGAPTISHHIKELSNAGLIFTEKKGKYLICKVNEGVVDQVSKLLKLQKSK